MIQLAWFPAGESDILLSYKEVTGVGFSRWLAFHEPAQTVDVRFKLKACSDAVVFLSPRLSVSGTGVQIVLGTCDVLRLQARGDVTRRAPHVSRRRFRNLLSLAVQHFAFSMKIH